MSKFQARCRNGRLEVGRSFVWDLKKNEGAYYEISRMTPESIKMRKFFEGAICPLFCYFQENLDHKNNQDIANARQFIKIHFNGDFFRVGDHVEKIAKSTKGNLVNTIEKAIQYLEEQFAVDRIVLLNPDRYKRWRDTIYSTGEHDNYIDYLISVGDLK